jgi:hypothetical protein
MSKIIAALIVVVCVALAFTNPGEKAHKDVVYQKLSGEAGMSGFLGEVAGDVMGNANLLQLRYKNYFFFSTMTFREDVVSFGLLNYVQTTDWDAKQATGMTGA